MWYQTCSKDVPVSTTVLNLSFYPFFFPSEQKNAIQMRALFKKKKKKKERKLTLAIIFVRISGNQLSDVSFVAGSGAVERCSFYVRMCSIRPFHENRFECVHVQGFMRDVLQRNPAFLPGESANANIFHKLASYHTRSLFSVWGGGGVCFPDPNTLLAHLPLSWTRCLELYNTKHSRLFWHTNLKHDQHHFLKKPG